MEESNQKQVIQLAKAILNNARYGRYNPQDCAEKARSILDLAGEDAGWYNDFNWRAIKGHVLFPEAHGD